MLLATRTIAFASLLLWAPAVASCAVAQATAPPLALTGATAYAAPDQPAIRNAARLTDWVLVLDRRS